MKEQKEVYNALQSPTTYPIYKFKNSLKPIKKKGSVNPTRTIVSFSKSINKGSPKSIKIMSFLKYATENFQDIVKKSFPGLEFPSSIGTTSLCLTSILRKSSLITLNTNQV